MNSKLPVWAVVPAAGAGRRMRNSTPKQYLQFQGKTVIEHCLQRLLSHPEIAGAVVVLNTEDKHWQELSADPGKPVFTASGGAERQHSVYSGLTTLQFRIGNEAIALVHDVVRPLVSHADLTKLIRETREHVAGAILAAPVADTLKAQTTTMQIANTVAREGLWRALTPQAFHLLPLLNAYRQVIEQDLQVTDDAQAIELMGYAPALVEGSTDNIKITTPADLSLAEMIWLNQRDQNDHE